MKRKDNRTLETFKKDIKFGTFVESFWMEMFKAEMNGRNGCGIISCRDNGVDNSGKYVARSNGNADYHVNWFDNNGEYECPLEVKWCPTAGKATFKHVDLSNYIKQKAAIYFIYNSSSTSIRKPKDYSLEWFLNKVYENKDYIKWGIIPPKMIQFIIDNYEKRKISYMGGKPGYVIPEPDFMNIVELFDFKHAPLRLTK